MVIVHIVQSRAVRRRSARRRFSRRTILSQATIRARRRGIVLAYRLWQTIIRLIFWYSVWWSLRIRIRRASGFEFFPSLRRRARSRRRSGLAHHDFRIQSRRRRSTSITRALLLLINVRFKLEQAQTSIRGFFAQIEHKLHQAFTARRRQRQSIVSEDFW